VNKSIKALEAKITKRLEQKIVNQDAHIARMIAHNPTQPSIKAAKKIAEMFRQQLADVQAVR
jgi:predicted ABC-type ATPase